MATLFGGICNPYTPNAMDCRSIDVLSPVNNIRITETAEDFGIIKTAVREAIRTHPSVLLLGGDHSLSYPAISALAEDLDLAVVHFDAHTDLNPNYPGRPFYHGSTFARIVENVSIRSLTQIGVRAVRPEQKELGDRFGVRMFSPHQLSEAEQCLPDGNVYISIDMDALDPAFAPGVSSLEGGGLTVREICKLIAAIPGRVIGADVVEFNPDRDLCGVTAASAVTIMKHLIDRLALRLSDPGRTDRVVFSR